MPNDVFYAIELVNVQNKREEEHKRRYAGAKNPPAISFKVETREVEKLSRDPELVEQVRIINQPVFAFAQAKIFLREIGAGDVAEKSARLYEFAVSEEAKAAVRYMPAIRRGPGI